MLADAYVMVAATSKASRLPQRLKKLETGKWKLENRKWKLDSPILGDQFPISNFQFRNFTDGSILAFRFPALRLLTGGFCLLTSDS